MINCGFVGLLGLPNVGKSSFLNNVLGEKISIVSNKPQTTRQAFSGIVSTKEYQLIFLDAPGYVPDKPGLFNFLHAEFQKVIERSELLMVLISHEQRETSEFNNFYEKIKASGKPIFVLFTKTDIEPTEFVMGLKSQLKTDNKNFGEWSLHNKDKSAAESLLKEVSRDLKAEIHPLYDPDMISLDQTRDIVAEFIREQCFLQLDKEIPFGIGIVIKSFKREKGLRHIQANILIEKENHKAIVIGKSGSRLKNIGKQARAKIEELLGEKIFLGLHVAHKKNWQKSSAIMKEVGYVHDK